VLSFDVRHVRVEVASAAWSKYVGVKRHATNYRAEIKANGKTVSLGGYPTDVI